MVEVSQRYTQIVDMVKGLECDSYHDLIEELQEAVKGEQDQEIQVEGNIQLKQKDSIIQKEIDIIRKAMKLLPASLQELTTRGETIDSFQAKEEQALQDYKSLEQKYLEQLHQNTEKDENVNFLQNENKQLQLSLTSITEDKDKIIEKSLHFANLSNTLKQENESLTLKVQDLSDQL